MANDLLHDLKALCRLKISLMVGLAAAFGYALYRPSFDTGLFLTLLGVILLSCACSAWNQAQEASTDCLMERTCKRPVARGSLRPSLAWFYGFCLLLPALLVLNMAGGLQLLVLGLAVVFTYNGAYTPLKKHTCFSLLVGAVAGASPVVFGWVAAGGSIGDPLLVLLYGLYLLWQIPHFWLRVDKNRADYQNAGLPVPPLLYAEGLYGRILGLWFYAFSSALLLVPAFPLIQNSSMRISIAVTGVAMLGLGAFCFSTKKLTQRVITSPNSEKDHMLNHASDAPVLYLPCNKITPQNNTILLAVDGIMCLTMTLIFLGRIWGEW